MKAAQSMVHVHAAIPVNKKRKPVPVYSPEVDDIFCICGNRQCVEWIFTLPPAAALPPYIKVLDDRAERYAKTSDRFLRLAVIFIAAAALTSTVVLIIKWVTG